MHDTSEVKQSSFRMKNILLHFMLCWILHSTKCSVTKQPDYNQTKELQNRNQSEEHPCNRQTPNPCCYNEYLNNSTNSCTECPIGSYGWNCKSRCFPGYFGRLCQIPCPCNVSECHIVTGCIPTNYSQSTIMLNTTKRPESSLQHVSKGVKPEISTYRGTNSPKMTTFGIYLLGTLSTFFVVGCFFLFYSRRANMNFNCCFLGVCIRQLICPCIDQDNVTKVTQEDTELSTVNRTSLCEHVTENEDPYSEIRYSQCIEESSSLGACGNTNFCPMRECDYSDKHKLYQTYMDQNVYDHIRLIINYSKTVSDKNPDSRNWDFVSRWSKQSLQKEELKKNYIKYQSLTFPPITTLGHKTGRSNKHKHLLPNYSMQLADIKLDAELDHFTEEVNQNSKDTDGMIDGRRNNRPYSLAHCLSKSDVNMDE
nr:uncharacterized protein LOC109621014 isoform X2 [Crassostrea gigas]